MMTIDERIQQAIERREYFDKVFASVVVVDQETADLVEVLVQKSIEEARKLELLAFMLPDNRYFSRPSLN